MISILSLGLVALLVVIFVTTQALRRVSRSQGSGPAGQLVKLDLDAFENLTDPDEERFLRLRLPAAEFRVVQRSRIRAAKAYIGILSENAGILVALGQTSRSSLDPKVAAAGQEILQKAIRLKVWCLVAFLRMDAALAFPVLLSPSTSVTGQYLSLTCLAASIWGKEVA